MPRKPIIPRIDFSDAMPFKIEGVYCKLISLTQRQFAILELEDFERLNRFNWWAAFAENTQTFYAIRYVNGRRVKMQNEVTGHLWTDHANNVTLDNRRKNLREADKTQSSCNRRKPKSNTSGYKGVMWRGNRRHWIAEIAFEGKTIYIGSYKQKIAAARAYDAKAIELHGEFARLNFPRWPITAEL